jgi:hypothetical protein
MADIAVQASFNSGEWAPALFARVDIQKYRSGAALLENFFVDYRGGASTRAGTRFIYPAPDGQIRLIPFQETSELGYVLVFTHLKLQFVSRGAVITEAAFNITAATQANPAVITATSNDFVAGDLIFITGIVGMTELNDRFFLVHSTGGGSTVTLDDFFGNPIDSTGYGAYVSGGTAARIYTIATPYSGTQLADIKYAQNVSQMVLCHPDQPPYLLTIVTANNWTLNPIVFGTTAIAPGVISLASSLAVGPVNYAYQVTSVDSNGQESVASPTGNYLGAQDLRTVGGSIQLTWSNVSGAVSYNVYKADVSYIGAVPPGATFGFIGFSTDGTFIDSNIAPDFTITPPVATNPFSGSGLYQTSITTPGTYTTVPSVALTGGTPTIGGSVAAVLQVQGTPTVSAGGAGYAVGDTVVFTNGVILRVATLTVTAVATWEPITDPFSSGGAVTSGATPANPVTQVSTSGAGTGVSANLTWGVGYLTILSPGAGYLSNPTAVFTPSGAVAVVTIAPAFAGNPTVPGFFQQRLVLAAPTAAPQTFWMSKPGQFFNFDVSFPIRPDDSISSTLVAGVLNTIEHLVSSTSGMLLLTDHGSWIVNGGQSGAAITPTALVANAQSFNGSRSNPAPIVANYDVLYPQQKGSSVRDLAFNIYFNVFTGTDISIMPSHLFFGHQIIDWTWAEEPFKVVWAIRDDGIMLSCTIMKEQEFVGWAHHVTNGTYEAVASVTEPDEETGDVFVDAVYLAVQR